MPARTSDRAASLLLRALDSLKPADRTLVLEALLTGSIGAIRGRWRPDRSMFVSELPSFTGPVSQQMEQPLLIRCSSELHSRLRKWATANGFSMASVARGLIERFLDEQESKGSTRTG
jgi:hypothetical protein